MTPNLDSLDGFFLLQEFNIETKDRKGSKILVIDDLLRIFTEYTHNLVGFSDHFPDDQLFAVSHALSLGLLIL